MEVFRRFLPSDNSSDESRLHSYTACELDARHLKILASQMLSAGFPPVQVDNRLKLVVGAFPDGAVIGLLKAEGAQYDAILGENVVHYMDSQGVQLAFKAFGELLRSGGRLFLNVTTPYVSWVRPEVGQFWHLGQSML